MPKHVSHNASRKQKRVSLALVFALVFLLVAGGLVAFFYYQLSTQKAPQSAVSPTSEPNIETASDQIDETQGLEQIIWEETATPVIAEYGDLLLHCPVPVNELTEILFHQSQVPWALTLSTQLPEASVEAAGNHEGTHRSAEQPTGNAYLNGSAFHLWRTDGYMPMDTAIDCGGAAGATVGAPVSGKVIHIRTYILEGAVEDFEVHIQPYDHPELDVVLIHISDVCVQVGDEVVAGITPIARVRDISQVLTGIQLEYYVPAETGGNHTHVQVNDINYDGYVEARLS